MKNRNMLIIVVLILLVGLGYLYTLKTAKLSQNSVPVLGNEEKVAINQKEYTEIKFPNGPTFEYLSGLHLEDNYDENKTFVLESSTNYTIVYVIENYSQSLFTKAGNGKMSNDTGSVEYLGTREFGKNVLVEFKDCGLDTCQNVFVLKGPKDQALVMEGSIDFINPNSIVFD